MSNSITIELRNVYGRETAYPGCDKAREFCRMLATRTLTPHHLRSIKALGYTINVADCRTQSQLLAAIGG